MQFSVIVGGIVEASLVQQLAFAHGYLWRSSSDKVQRLGDFSRYINFDFNIKRFYQCSSYDNAFKPTVTLNELGDYLSGAKKNLPYFDHVVGNQIMRIYPQKEIKLGCGTIIGKEKVDIMIRDWNSN